MWKSIVSLAFGASAFAFGACDGSGSSDTGRLEIALTDAPGDGLQSAFIVVSEVYLQGEGGRVVLRDTPLTVDLATLSNSLQTLVAVDVPSGRYSELRLVIDGAWIEVATDHGMEVYASKGFEAQAGGEVTGELKTPSWGSSGLKLKLPGDELVVAGGQRVLVVDFDLAETFQTTTGNGAVLMSPVVHVNDIGFTTGLTFHVQVASGLVGTVLFVEIYDRNGNAEGTLELTDDDDDGVYEASFVYLDPSEGPFMTRFVTADGFVVTSLGGELAVAGTSGLTITTDVQLVAVVTP